MPYKRTCPWLFMRHIQTQTCEDMWVCAFVAEGGGIGVGGMRGKEGMDNGLSHICVAYQGG